MKRITLKDLYQAHSNAVTPAQRRAAKELSARWKEQPLRGSDLAVIMATQVAFMSLTLWLAIALSRCVLAPLAQWVMS